MGPLVLGAFGVYPLSGLLGGVVNRDLRPAAFFPLAGAMLALAVTVGFTESGWRAFGATGPDGVEHVTRGQPEHSE